MPNLNDVASSVLPQITLVFAGLLAPAQLAFLNAENLLRLAMSGALLGVDVVGLLLDRNMYCMTESWDFLSHTHALHEFILVDALALSFTMVVSVQAFMEIQQTYADIEASASTPTELPADPEEAFKVRMEASLLQGAYAMLSYDRLTTRPAFKLLPYISMFDFVWQMSGWVVFVDTPGLTCPAKFLLYWVRGRGI
eukprot:CAMPEP_0115347818 /NCGR_PEP_ID=MMETSP0270-20121206/95081_1 /TAXON_ID=71861 /ORGANISM="Scrippsiella trochoidea, Strain CCMP3099" /LENGTH=195 /DNA_ID=CAMNT_0002769761 /DNA_START=18 /DNA_END=602 /DNA_ORIENTATION=-